MTLLSYLVVRRGPLFTVRSHWLRFLLDLSYASICLELKRSIRLISTRRQVLDYGAGDAPWRRFFLTSTYTTIDPFVPADYSRLEDLPQNYSADLILLIEVLEHAEAPLELLSGIKKVLSETGELWISVPFQARVHECPGDYQRWTPSGLARLLESQGWEVLELRARGGDWSLLISKWIFFWGRRLARPLLFVPAFIVLVLSLPLVVVLGQLSLRLGWGYPDEALGWFLRVRSRD